MQLDPSRWLVSLAGFLSDWILTREWTRVLLAMLPAFFLVGVVGLVWWGQQLDRGLLAQWYMELGDREIVDWEQAWAPADVDAGPEGGKPSSSATERPLNPASNHTATENSNVQGHEAGQRADVSRFAEILFRRVQQLVPSDRSQYVIAATLAQRGALGQAQAMLRKIAPDNQAGYAPAHALLAQFYLEQLQQQQPPTADLIKAAKHHVAQAKRWDRAPQSVLLFGSRLFELTGDQAESLSLLSRSAERNPQVHLELAKQALRMGNQRVFDQAWSQAEKHFKQVLAADPLDQDARLQLANVYVLDKNLDLAEELLQEGRKLAPTPQIARGLSEIYRVRFLASFQEKGGGGMSADVQLLDMALQLDPNNPLVVEEVARLAQVDGPRASKELVDRLQMFLAEGKATAATHAWLAKLYLVRKEYEKAIPHLEQAIRRLNEPAEYLNNLAYVIAELYPDRLQEALEMSKRAVAVALQSKQPNADYYDTLGFVLAKMQRSQEAITAFETAIEMSPQRIEFHRQVAEQYRRVGNEGMAEKHEQVIERLQQTTADSAQAGQKPPTEPASAAAQPADYGDALRGPAPSRDNTPALRSDLPDVDLPDADLPDADLPDAAPNP
ncbi:MAG: tetratricopeptide repeat protein [Planctomycetales bacterium]|nr:tetratricopeptide repeat protein [Planctomycetales bacterium]